MGFDTDDSDIGPIQHGGGGQRQRVKAKKWAKFPLGVWVECDAGSEFATWVRTLANLPDGRVACVLRSGVPLIVARSFLTEPVKRKRPRR
jgi:hypothetical protein